MSNQPTDDADLLKFIQKERQRLAHISEAERQALIEQRVRDALAQERAVERQENEEAAEALGAELAYDPARERDRARETAKSAALLLIMLLLILLLVAAATGRTDILPIPGVQPTQTLGPYLSNTPVGPYLPDMQPPSPPFPPGVTPAVDPSFVKYWSKFQGVCSIGDPITPGFTQQGARYQWFQRGLLHELPDVDDPEWHVQGYLLGREVTTGIFLPTSAPYLSQPGAYLFRETGYSVSGPFLTFWDDCDGLHLLGYPVSDLVSEVLTPGSRVYQVQYFERGRLEYHPDDPNAPVQFGLLGDIKRKDANFRANIVTPQAATPVTVPAPTITPVTVPAPTITPVTIPAPTVTPAYPGP